MDREQARNTVRWASGINVLAGIWLIIAPLILGYAELFAPFWNDVTVGATIAAMALIRVGAPLRYPELGWINAGLGAWLIFAPVVLGYAGVAEGIAGAAAVTANGTVVAVVAEAAYWNDVIVGIVVLVLAAWSAAAGRLPATALAAPPGEIARGRGE
jgi:SPW repeat